MTTPEMNEGLAARTISTTFHVAGVSHDNRDGSSRQSILAIIEKSDSLWVEREPDNPHDQNALRVMSKYGQVGYVPSKISDHIKEVSEKLISIRVRSKGRAENGLFGCEINLTYQTSRKENETKVVGVLSKRRGGVYSFQFVEDNGRVFFDAVFLAALNNDLSDIVVEDDNLQVCHRTHGKGVIVGVRKRSGREALFKVNFIDNPKGSGEFSSGSFSGSFFRGDGLFASIRKEAWDKYHRHFSSVDFNNIDMAIAGMQDMTRKLSGCWLTSKVDADPYGWENDYGADDYGDETRRESEDAGFSWYDYHKHD